MTAPAVEVSGLRHRYGDREALAGLSFSVEPGSLLALLGPNGGGKTTLFRILATLMRPDEGEALLFGKSVTREPREVRALLGVVFQKPAIDGKLTVQENLRCRSRFYGMTRADARRREGEAMDALGLAARADDRAETLSGGLQRRVELAMSLLHRPAVLLLDEPSTGLDPSARRDFLALLEEERRSRGATILLTTHFIEEAERCDRVGMLAEGRLIALDQPARLKSSVTGDVVVVQADEIGLIADGVRRRFGLEPVVTGNSLRIEVQSGHKMLTALVDEFPDRLRAVSWGPPTLEDVFFRLTGKGLREAAE